MGNGGVPVPFTSILFFFFSVFHSLFFFSFLLTLTLFPSLYLLAQFYLNKSHCRGPWKWMDYSVFLHWFFFSIALIEVLNLDRRFYTFFCDSTLLPRTNEPVSFSVHEITPCNLFLLWFLLRTKSFFVFFFLIACPYGIQQETVMLFKVSWIAAGSKMRWKNVVKTQMSCQIVM